MERELVIPAEIEKALHRGAALAISISGGKDSQAMLSAVSCMARKYQLPGHVFAIHADLGRAEWSQTPGVVEAHAATYDVPLEVVRRAHGDLFHRIEGRLAATSSLDPSRPPKPFFPSSAQRYCTSDLKRDPINKHLRRYQDVVSAIGLRREESAARARKAACVPNHRITTARRSALIWHPILDWTTQDVWRELGTSSQDLERRQDLYRQGQEAEALAGWPAHPAYVFGNERLSCALCVLASRSDLENGARHNPEALDFLVGLEERSGYTFRDGFSLTELKAWARRKQEVA